MASKKKAEPVKKAAASVAVKSTVKKPKATREAKAAAKPKAAPRKPSKPSKAPKKPARVAVKKPAKSAVKKPTPKPAAKRKPRQKPSPRPRKKPSGLPANLSNVLRELEEASKGKRALDNLPALDAMLGRPRDEPLTVSDSKGKLDGKKQKPEPKEERDAGDETGDYLAAQGWTVYNLTDGFDASLAFSEDDFSGDRAPRLPRFGKVPGVFWRAEITFKGNEDDLSSYANDDGYIVNPSGGTASSGGNGGEEDGAYTFTAKTAWHNDTVYLEETIDTVIEEATDKGWKAILCEVICYFRFDHKRPERVTK